MIATYQPILHIPGHPIQKTFLSVLIMLLVIRKTGLTLDASPYLVAALSLVRATY